ncbi:TPA: hypothetical protein N0F65_008962 [Lagenidium giganteum]|uniref:Sec16 Sec23-binding domain-containing protein n=1 Tax=Lagenidium giganteum TaxID=4803 RepID=A0AAV2YYM5_9STRA|nr:TPA: hypothetical protein N0F65_008962 [Lagenidium giganteum]
MEHLHPKDQYHDQLEKFPGPLSENVGQESILKYIEDKMKHPSSHSDVDEDTRLLYGILRVLVKSNGKLRADPGTGPSDPNSPEVQLVALLNHPDAILKSSNKIRDLLLTGDRKGAVEVAMHAQMWPEAMLIASFTDKDEYKRVLTTFLNGHYAAGDPCRTLFLSFADQQEKSVQEPQKLMPSAHQSQPSAILSSWVTHAQVILANRTADTNRILTELGDRLWKEQGNVVAAHVCYLLAGNTVEAPSPNSKIALLGADHRTPKEARFYVSADAVQRTEMYEWIQKQANANSANMIPFQGYKLIHAMVLADHGKLETAFKYVDSMLTTIKAVTATMKPGASMYLEGMQNQLTVLDDRLRQHLGQVRVDSVSSSNGKQGKWGLGSALSIMGKIVNRVVEGNDAPAPGGGSSSAASFDGQHGPPGGMPSYPGTGAPAPTPFPGTGASAPTPFPSTRGSFSTPAPAPGNAPPAGGYGLPPVPRPQQPGMGFGAPPPAPSMAPSAPGPSPPKFQKPTLDLSGDAGKHDMTPVRRTSESKSRSPTAAGNDNKDSLTSGPSSDKGSASPKFKDTKKGGRSKTPPPSNSKAAPSSSSGSSWFSGLSSFIATKMNPEAKQQQQLQQQQQADAADQDTPPQ